MPKCEHLFICFLFQEIFPKLQVIDTEIPYLAKQFIGYAPSLNLSISQMF